MFIKKIIFWGLIGVSSVINVTLAMDVAETPSQLKETIYKPEIRPQLSRYQELIQIPAILKISNETSSDYSFYFGNQERPINSNAGTKIGIDLSNQFIKEMGARIWANEYKYKVNTILIKSIEGVDKLILSLLVDNETFQGEYQTTISPLKECKIFKFIKPRQSSLLESKIKVRNKPYSQR